MTLKFLGSFGTKPLYAFGMPGLVSLVLGGLLFGGITTRKLLLPHDRIRRTPLVAISISFSGFGMQCIMMGLLAELLMRTYHESQGKPIYVVKTVSSHPQADSLVVDEEKDSFSQDQEIALDQPARRVIEAI